MPITQEDFILLAKSEITFLQFFLTFFLCGCRIPPVRQRRLAKGSLRAPLSLFLLRFPASGARCLCSVSSGRFGENDVRSYELESGRKQIST